ncbi:MAG: potassium/proton antiporter [Flavobacteriales bacterium]|nr:potassium/proton antiporter [Flavobacteriales bacterium]
MNVSIEKILLVGALLLMVSILASKTSGRLGVPSLLLFLGVGMLAGTDGLRIIDLQNAGIAQFLGTVALVFILFSGGLDTRLESVRPVLWRGLSLSTIGVLLTAAIVGISVPLFTPLGWKEGLLLGAIISSTDAAAVFTILRSKGMGLKGSLRPTLEFESGSNDPMAYFLTTGMLTLITSGDASPWQLVPMFLLQMTIGGLMGYGMGLLMTRAINRIKLDFDGLYPVLLLALIMLTFAATDVLGGNGFLAVYIAGIMMGNDDFLHKKSLIRFYDGQAWLMQIVMFLALGLLVNPRELVPVMGAGVGISLVLMFIARPLAVMLTLIPFRMSFAKQLMISWVGLRGAVPIVLATYPMMAGLEHAGLIFNIVFFIVITSVALQGTTLPVVARWLGLERPESARSLSPYDQEISTELRGELRRVLVGPQSTAVGRSMVQMHFPLSTLATRINRGSVHIFPSGATRLEAGDVVTMITSRPRDVEELVREWGLTLIADPSDANEETLRAGELSKGPVPDIR